MPTPFIMPKMDMDQETVKIIEWLKKEGDVINKGEPVIEIETDKITSEIEAPASGILTGILYQENEDVPVTQVIAYILAEGETKNDLPETAKPKPESSVIKSEDSTLKSEKSTIQATPVAARMADAEGINLENVPSKGEKITKGDIESYLSLQGEVQPRVSTPATPAARRIASEVNLDLTKISGSGPRGRIQAADVIDAQSAFTPGPLTGSSQTMSTIRKRIAERLTASYQTTPHIYLNVEVDMNEAEASRRRMNELAAKDGLPEISLTAYLLRIVAWALKRNPSLNALSQDDEIVFHDQINIGVATALEDGLIVPVIHNSDTLSAREINQRLRDLIQKARTGTLVLDDIQGGTFTISNLGMFGIQSFTAIINPPQSAILAVGTLTRRPIVVDESDTIVIRPMMMLTLAADHRIIDGAVAAAFLSDLVKALETPELVLF